MHLIQSIQNRIYEIRGERVMLDKDLAALYDVETRVLNQAVKRNSKRFPPDFMFQLTREEWESLQAQVKPANTPDNSRSQIVILNTAQGKNLKYYPYAFTEHGVAALSGVLNSDKAIQMNIAIIRAFIEMRRLAIIHTDWKEQIRQIRDKISEHDTQLYQIYDALENLLDEKATQKKWEERERIGFNR